MTSVQIVLSGVFIVVLVSTYWAEIVAFCNKCLGALTRRKPVTAAGMVDDIVALTALRERLAAIGHQAGVDACTILLRAIVEHNPATKDVV